jgi:hypothetical protein
VIVRGAISPDHIHRLLSAPPHLAPAKIVQYIKGGSSRKLQEESPDLRALLETPVGEGVFLRDGGRSGRANDQSLNRKPTVGRGRAGLQDHCAHRKAALQPQELQTAFAAPRLSVAKESTGFSLALAGSFLR